ncbi:MAG: polyhydroxyalkanoate synthesis regulator DNA-binding domain-containing protein [Phycisphaerales bacterium]|nr:polyhydroxyalkanoate synthesis regulator DNA-binding domain-containing protein [Phycisphaerales bacterium]
MPDNNTPRPVQIKKYPNRRYYDTFQSRHVTLQEVHDLIVSGRDVCVIDSRTGEDITNVVLMQILLEKDHPKLDLFPSSILHMMIRSNRQALRNTVERFFGPFLGLMAASQKQFDAYLRKTMHGQLVSPLDWAGGMLRAFGGEAASTGPASDEAPSDSPDEPVAEGQDAATLHELQSQIDTLRQRIEQIGEDRSHAGE